jgi:hypothetical protein
MDVELKKVLEELGFAKYHSRILLYLISIGKYVDARQIEAGSGVPLSRIYSIVLELKKSNLILTLPGKTNLYAAQPKTRLISAIKVLKEKQMAAQKQKLASAYDVLNRKLAKVKTKGPSDVIITHYHRNEDYWLDYLKTETKLRRGDTHRIINNIRLCPSFIKEELNNMPKCQASVMRGEGFQEDSAKVQYILNPKSLVKNTISDLREHSKVKLALKQALYALKKESEVADIFINEDTNRMLFVIDPDCVWMEFYGDRYDQIISALRIQSVDVARDFAKWFDSLAKSCTKKTYIEFEKDIKMWAWKLAKIKL